MALHALSTSHSYCLGRICAVHPRRLARSAHCSLRHQSWNSKQGTSTSTRRQRLRVSNGHGSSNGTHVHVEVEEDVSLETHVEHSAVVSPPASTSYSHVQSSNGASISNQDGHKGTATQPANTRERRYTSSEHADALPNMSSEEYSSQLLTSSGDSGDIDDESTFLNCVDEECTVEESRWWWKRALGLPKGGLLENTFETPAEQDASQEAAAKEQRRRLRAVVLQLLITLSPLAIAWVVIHVFLTPHPSPSFSIMPNVSSPSTSLANNNPVTAAVSQHLSQSPMSPFYSYLAGTAGAAGTLGLAAKLGGSIGFGAASSGVVSSAAGVAGLAGTIGQSVDTTWRTLGGASVAALYWRTFVFGKTFRIVEWQLGDNERGGSDVPDGKMKSVTIRRPGLAALKNAVATEFKLRRASEVVQLSHWVSFGGTTFYEPLTTAKEVNTLPDNAWLVFARVPESITPIPRRGSSNSKQSSSKTTVGQDQHVEGLLTLLAELHVEQKTARDAHHASSSVREVHPAPSLWGHINGAEREFDTLLDTKTPLSSPLLSTTLATLTETKDTYWMSDADEDRLVSLALAADARLLALYRAYGDRSQQQFLRHALNYARGLHRQD